METKVKLQLSKSEIEQILKQVLERKYDGNISNVHIYVPTQEWSSVRGKVTMPCVSSLYAEIDLNINLDSI